MDQIHLPPELYKAMIDQVVTHLPDEACGLVGGRDGRALRLYPVDNILHSPLAFEMEPLQQIRAMLAIEAEDMELLAIYHSHPDGPARPSASDVAQAYYPETAQIIISLADPMRPSARAFLIQDGQVKEITLARHP